jgi:hypothetical protein
MPVVEEKLGCGVSLWRTDATTFLLGPASGNTNSFVTIRKRLGTLFFAIVKQKSFGIAFRAARALTDFSGLKNKSSK